MRSSCWKKRRYSQYDLALQIMGIFQTLIGALLASSIVAIIEKFEASDALETAYIALYVGGIRSYPNELFDCISDMYILIISDILHVQYYGRYDAKKLAF